MASLAETLASLKSALAAGGALSAVRFVAAGFETTVVEKELAAIHQSDALPTATALYAVCIEALAADGAREKLAWQVAAAQAPPGLARSVELATELLRSPLGARENPILKLIFAAQYAELLARRQSSHSSPS